MPHDISTSVRHESFNCGSKARTDLVEVPWTGSSRPHLELGERWFDGIHVGRSDRGVGIYGVVSHAVSRRTHDMGVRVALGATPVVIQRDGFTDGMRPVLIGLAVGIGGTVLIGRARASRTRAGPALTDTSDVALPHPVDSLESPGDVLPVRNAALRDLAWPLLLEST